MNVLEAVTDGQFTADSVGPAPQLVQVEGGFKKLV